MLKGFKDFIMRGNVIELATGVIIGAAFTAIVTAVTNNLIQPLINAVGGGGEVGGMRWQIRSGDTTTIIDLGAIITAVINFLIVAAVVYFLIVMPINKLAAAAAKRKDQDVEEVASASETDLLIEIRDLLAAQNGVPTPSNGLATGAAGAADAAGRHSAD